MMSLAYETGLPEALDRGLVALATIDAAVAARPRRSRHRLGLLDDPYRRCTGPDPETPPRRPRRRRREAAAPLDRPPAEPRRRPAAPGRPGRIALIGPLADAPRRDARPLGRRRPRRRGGRRARRPARRPARRRDRARRRASPIEGGDTDGIAEAVAAAARADHVILCLGEAAWMSGEAASRARIDLPGRQAELAAAVLATGTPGRRAPLLRPPARACPRSSRAPPPSLACWFPGSEAGHAVAALLTGATAPSAGLAVTWPRDVGQVPIAYSVRSGGRPENPADKYTSKYLDLPNTPQFPFGHGLAYTELRPDRPAVERSARRRRRRPPRVTNTGARAGAATVFLFIRDPVASVARPILELRALRPRRARPRRDADRSASTLDRSDFAFPGADLQPVVEPGRVRDPRRLLRRPGRPAQRPLHAATEPRPAAGAP